MSELKRPRFRRRLAIRSNTYWLSIFFCLYILSLGSLSCDRTLSSSSNDGAASLWWGHPSAFACGSTDVKEPEYTEDTEQKSSLRKPQSQIPLYGEKKGPTLNEILIRAGKSGLGGGIPGALAGMVQVCTLMWLRTIINYQCRYGTTFSQALLTLTKEGGIGRLYSGLSFALVQAPLARFVSTAANDGVETLLSSLNYTKDWGPGRTTVVASIVVGVWRMIIMPIDTMKTVLQVDSVEGFRNLMRRVKAGKINVLYQGAIANAFSAVLGHYPWFLTYNSLSTNEWVKTIVPSQLLRNAGIGFVASIISDTFVNAIRVVKTTKQSIGSKHAVGYWEIVRMIKAADGWKGLFGRGLRTRIFANALQSIVFIVIWRGLADMWKRRGEGENSDHSG